MAIVLGIESTAHTFGVGVVGNSKVLSNCKRSFSTGSGEGGMIPIEVAKFHSENKEGVYSDAIKESGIKEKDIDCIAFSQGPGLAPCLLEGMKFVKELSLRLGKPVVGVNHCIAHLEIGGVTGAEDAVMLYASGANTQVIAFEAKKYRVFGETLDLGVGNFIDGFGRFIGVGFPAGPAIQKLAEKGKKYIELPYSVKGMDVAFSGIQTKLRGIVEGLRGENKKLSSQISEINNKLITKEQLINGDDDVKINKVKDVNSSNKSVNHGMVFSLPKSQLSRAILERDYTIPDLCYSIQETVFAMLVEVAERALAHTEKNELLLGGGVACNTRLQEMCRIMCEERGAKLFVPPNSLLVDNAGMIAYLGEIMFDAGIYEKDLEKVDICPRERTDDVCVGWR